MHKLFIAILSIAFMLSLTANAGQGKRKLTPEQKALHKEILEKYDTDKNGKLDKKERASISKEDKERMEKAGLGHKKHASKSN